MKKIYTFISLFVCQSLLYSQIPQKERQALIDFFKTTHNSWACCKWDTTKAPSNWYGITIENNHVTHILFENGMVTGAIPATFGQLDSLRSIDLSYNTLTGGLPGSLFKLKRLEEVRFAYCDSLSGGIPKEIGQATNLKVLELNVNILEGSIPQDIANLKRLETLSIGRNLIKDTIPAFLGQLSALKVLDLSDLQIVGRFPTFLNKLGNLEQLLLSNNKLNGTLPAEIASFQNLTVLDLSSNDLWGNLPKELGSLIKLQSLKLSSNDFTGSIPKELGNLKMMTFLGLSWNSLSDTIPEALGGLDSLTGMNLSVNDLEGRIPESFKNLKKLNSLFLGSNSLSGPIPDLTQNSSLKYFYISLNDFHFGDYENYINKFANQKVRFDYSEQKLVLPFEAATLVEGSDLVFPISVRGQANHYQWFLENDTLKGSTSGTLFLNKVSPKQSGYYYVKVTSDLVPYNSMKGKAIYVNVIPKCPEVIAPVMKDNIIGSTDTLKWEYLPNVDYYTLKMGYSPGSGEVFVENTIYNPKHAVAVKDLKVGSTVYFKITPYFQGMNANSNCPVYSLKVNSPLVGVFNAYIDQDLLAVYPNPAGQTLHIVGVNDNTPYQVRNHMGQVLFAGLGNKVQLVGLGTGHYWIQVGNVLRPFVVE